MPCTALQQCAVHELTEASEKHVNKNIFAPAVQQFRRIEVIKIARL